MNSRQVAPNRLCEPQSITDYGTVRPSENGYEAFDLIKPEMPAQTELLKRENVLPYNFNCVTI